MCLYCKKLKEINNLEKKNLQDIIDSWRRRDKQARDILELAHFVLSAHRHCDRENIPDFAVTVIMDKISDFLKKDWIGK